MNRRQFLKATAFFPLAALLPTACRKLEARAKKVWEEYVWIEDDPQFSEWLALYDAKKAGKDTYVVQAIRTP